MTIRIHVVGCQRYSYMGELFEKGNFYDLDDAKAKMLLGKKDDYGRHYFRRVEKVIDEDDIEVVEQETEVVGGVKITRKRGKAKKNSRVRTAGDTSTLDAEDADKAPAAADAGEDDEDDDGIEVG